MAESQRPGLAAYGGANSFEPPLGRPLAVKKGKSRGGVGGGVVSVQAPDFDALAAFLKKHKANRG